jgi:very-short-patch-repair endonuclease
MKKTRWQTSPDLWNKIKPIARQLRTQPTPAEKQLWQYLRGNQLQGAKFRRQHSIGPYIVDFYCHSARLVIKIDGPVHQYTHEEDAIRQTFLEECGLHVFRFTNNQVLSNIQSVLDQIEEILPSLTR